MTIITKEMVSQALLLVKPSIELLLKQPGMTWGPQWVQGYISCPGIDHDIGFIFGKVSEKWNPEWGEAKDFDTVAKKKLELAKRLGEDTSTITAVKPWMLLPDEYLYPGGASYLGVSAGTSGAMGHVDELISNMIIETIIMFARLEADRRKTAHEMKI